jgi:hypothetical protein
MEVGIVLFGVVDRRAERFVGEKRTVTDGACDAHELLIDDAARSDILMADFGIAHRPRRQSDILAAGDDVRGGPIPHESIGHGRAGEFHGIELVVLWMRIRAPAVADDENKRRIDERGRPIHVSSLRPER